MQDTPPESEKTFLDLANLYRINVKVSTLATAIEDHGIQGWDRYGRFKKFDPNDENSKRALDLLARQHEWECNVHNIQDHEPSPLDEVAFDQGYYLGWFEDDAPDFDAIAKGEVGAPAPPHPPRSRRAKTTDLNIIAVLLEVLMPMANCKSEAAVIRAIMEGGYGDYDGISKRTLEDRFKEAKRSLLQ